MRPVINRTTHKPWGYVKNKTNKYPTSQTGRLVHESSGSEGYPLCGRYMYGIVYTSLTPNCPKCLMIKAGVL